MTSYRGVLSDGGSGSNSTNQGTGAAVFSLPQEILRITQVYELKTKLTPALRMIERENKGEESRVPPRQYEHQEALMLLRHREPDQRPLSQRKSGVAAVKKNGNSI